MTIKSLGNSVSSFRNRFGGTGNRASKGAPPPGIIATGGNVDALAPGNGYKYHTFTSPGTFTVSSGNSTIEVLVVAGGGGAGGGGGGGAGGLVYHPSMQITTGSYPITIGSAGAAGPIPGRLGNDTTFNGLTAKGGGGGMDYYTPAPTNPQSQGGSGGGGSSANQSGNPTDPEKAGGTSNQSSQPQPVGSLQYGNPGGRGGYRLGGGGGGGAGTAGGNVTEPYGPGGTGGDGRQYPNFTGPLIGVPSLAPLSGYFAGGGGGGASEVPAADIPGGLGGGGLGGGGTPDPSAWTGTPGTANSGGGGGGGGGQSGVGGGAGGNGGSGIVIIRYLAS
jgi:hypothetical protein